MSTGQYLANILANTEKPHQPCLLLQSSASQSGLPLFLEALRSQVSSGYTILLSCLCPPNSLLKNRRSQGKVKIVDWSSYVPGYDEPDIKVRCTEVEKAIETGARLLLF